MSESNGIPTFAAWCERGSLKYLVSYEIMLTEFN
jgi:hypothetical protein